MQPRQDLRYGENNMSNLLPDSYQKKLLQQLRGRFIFVASVLLIAAALISAIALLPGFIVLYITIPEKPAPSASAQQNQLELADMSTTQILVQHYYPIVNATSTTQVLLAALDVRIKSIHVDHIEYVAGAPAIFILSGIADNRAAINAYREALIKSNNFKSVTVPVGDLIGSQGGRFKITLTGEF